MVTKSKDFTEVMTELLQEQMENSQCGICTAKDRDKIELARKNGASYPLLAKALQKVGTISPNISTRTARDRVAAHFQVHTEDPHPASYPKQRNGRPGGKAK